MNDADNTVAKRQLEILFLLVKQVRHDGRIGRIGKRAIKLAIRMTPLKRK